MVYRPLSGRACLAYKNTKASITLWTSSNALYEGLKYNHLNDLSISMFTRIDVKSKYFGPRFVYILFILIEIDDHGHFKSFKNFKKFVQKNILRLFKRRYKN